MVKAGKGSKDRTAMTARALRDKLSPSSSGLEDGAGAGSGEVEDREVSEPGPGASLAAIEHDKERLMERLKVPEHLKPFLRKGTSEEILLVRGALGAAFEAGRGQRVEAGGEEALKGEPVAVPTSDALERAYERGVMAERARILAMPMGKVVVVCNAADAWLAEFPKLGRDGRVTNQDAAKRATELLIVAIEEYRARVDVTRTRG